MRETGKSFEAMRERQGSLSPGSTTSKTQVRETKNVLTALQQVFGTSYSYEFTRPIVHHPDDPGSPLPSDDEKEERNANDSKGSRQSSESNHYHRRSKSRPKSRQKPRLSSLDISYEYDNTLRLSRSTEDPTADQKRRSRSRRRTRKTQYYRSKSPITPKLIARHHLNKFEGFDERETANAAAAAAGIPSIIHTRVDGMCKSNAILLPHRKGGLQCLPMEVQPLPKMETPKSRRIYAEPQTKVPPFIGFSRSNDDAMYGL